MRKSRTWFTVALIAVAGLSLTAFAVGADEARPQPRIGDRTPDTVAAAPRLGPPPVGTVQYDNNVPFQRDGQDGGAIGNRFNAGFGNPHTFQSASFRMANVFGGSAVGAIWNSAGVVVTSWLATGLTAGTAMTHVVPLANMSNSGSFFGAMLQTGYDPCSGLTGLNSPLTCEGVALTEGTMDPGLGFHAARVSVAATVIPPVSDIAGQNAIFRVTGSNIPVELMSFDVE